MDKYPEVCIKCASGLFLYNAFVWNAGFVIWYCGYLWWLWGWAHVRLVAICPLFGGVCRRYPLGCDGLFWHWLSVSFRPFITESIGCFAVFLLHWDKPALSGRLDKCHQRDYFGSIGSGAWFPLVGYGLLYGGCRFGCVDRFLYFCARF